MNEISTPESADFDQLARFDEADTRGLSARIRRVTPEHPTSYEEQARAGISMKVDLVMRRSDAQRPVMQRAAFETGGTGMGYRPAINEKLGNGTQRSMDLSKPFSKGDRHYLETIVRNRIGGSSRPMELRAGDRYRKPHEGSATGACYAKAGKYDIACDVLGGISPAQSVEEFNQAGYGFELSKEMFYSLHSSGFSFGLPEDVVLLMQGENGWGKTLDELAEKRAVPKITIPLSGQSKQEVDDLLADAFEKLNKKFGWLAMIRIVVDGEAQPISAYVRIDNPIIKEPGKIARWMGRGPDYSVNVLPIVLNNVLKYQEVSLGSAGWWSNIMRRSDLPEILEENDDSKVFIEAFLFAGDSY